MKGDDLKFLSAVAATLVLLAALVWSTHVRDLASSRGPVVDRQLIEQRAAQGRISLHPADHWEVAEPGESEP